MEIMKYWIYLFLWFPFLVQGQLLPANRFFNSNQTNTFIWDNTSSNGVVNNGSGTWNATNLTWLKLPNGVNQLWTNGSSATFGGNPGQGSAGTVTVSGTQNVKSLIFDPTSSGNFILQNGSLNLQGGLWEVNQNATISSTLQGIANYTKKGNANLTLTGNNSYSGTLTISQGGIYASATNAMGTSPVILGDANTGTSNIEWRWAGSTQPSTSLTVSNLGTGTVTIGAYSVGLNTQHSGNIALGRDVILFDGSNDRSSFEGIISGTVSSITINGTGSYSNSTGRGARVTFDNNLNSFTGKIFVLSGKAFQFNASNAANSNAIECNGDIVINSFVTITPVMGTLTGSGRVAIHPETSADASFTIGNDNESGAFSGTIIDGGGEMSIIKVGTGTQLLTSTSSFNGTTTINNGVLGGTGTLSNSATTIVNSNGKIMGGLGLGNAGVFTTEDLVFSNGSTAAINVYSNGSALSRVQVNGTCNLGTTSKVNLMQAMPTGTYNIISSTGNMSGTVPTLGTNLSGRSVSITRVGRNLRVTLS
jgi:fibronectin-binding autotransporter adhesin